MNVTSVFTRALATVCVLALTTACRHKAASISVPTHGQGIEQAAMEPDQENAAPWDGAWTNLVNDVEQTFTPSLPRLTGVEVELVVGNAGAKEDELTLDVLDANGQSVAVITRSVPTADLGPVIFIIPKNGVDVNPGQTYRLKLNGGTTFGWKYVVGGYEAGAATFNGKPLLADTRTTFLFRTFGAK